MDNGLLYHPIHHRGNPQDALSKEAQEKGITEEDLLNELEVVWEEMWNEQKK
ncbi:MAG: hypothetical protein WA125_18160 [Desulfosporosinus sp.]